MNTNSGPSKATRPQRVSAAVGTRASSSASGGLLSGSSSRYSLRDKGFSHASSSARASVATAAAREEAKRRLLEMKNELEGAVHVLDGGVNRTPLPLQHRHSLVGGLAHDAQISAGGSMRLDMTQDSNATTALMNAELGTSFLHSSFMMSSSMRSNARKQSTMSVDREGSNARFRRGGGDSGSKSMESSMQSLSFANDRQLADQSSSALESTYRNGASGGGGGSSMMHRGSSTSNAVPRLVQQNTLLSEAAYVRPAPLSEEKKAAWRRAITAITLSETPTLFLYSHHDEAVSKEDAEEVAAVTARNKAYAAVEEAFRTDEGTRFHSTGVATLRAPLKSIHAEVHPPAKKDSGALQVTPWMLRDAYEAALADMNGGEDDDIDDPQQQQQQLKDEAAGGEVEDALREDGEDIHNEIDGDEDQTSDAALSTALSSDDAGTTAPSAANEGAPTKPSVEPGRQWMMADTLLSTLRVMERAVVQNYIEAAQLAYRGITMEPESHRVPKSNATTGGKPEGAAATRAKAVASPPPLPPSPASPHSPLAPIATDATATAAATQPTGSEREGNKDAAASQGEGADGTAKTTAPAAASAASTVSTVPVRVSEDVRLLWRFGSSQLTRHRGVACMTWNRREMDILAVGYTACRTATARAAGGRTTANTNDASSGKGNAPSAVTAGEGMDNDAHDGGMVLKRALGQEAYGMICCWSLKNPLAPELILFLRHEADVTALAFSNEHPSLLAVGSSTGEIAVYDIQRDVVFPSIAPAAGTTAGQHTGAIWELQWVPKGKEQGEFLTSISADGRVVQWAVGKSIERVAPDLMHLQRQPGTQVEQAFVDGVAEAEAAAAAALDAAATAGGKKGGKLHPRPPQKHIGGTAGGAGKDRNAAASGGAGGASAAAADDAVLSRQCGGMCFDVCPVDTAIYVVGTEDGSVLQCSKSQTENYDFEYESHAELVYRVRWSPYSAAYFLTCSADWTSRLYKVGTRKAQLRFNSLRQDAVQDVAWSPTNALIFATATAQGSAEVWTVMDVMCPRASIEYEDHRHLSAILFADQETPVLVVGDEEGDVTVFSLVGACYTRQELTDDEQEAWMADAVRKQLT